MLFRYLYPIVKLKVKGFYGKGVTYNLALSKFNAEFDPEVGNFVINADFIGYIYGIYADFPLNYCTVAPYMSYEGAAYWNANLTRTFKYAESEQPIYKYTELKQKIEEFNTNADAILRGSTSDSATELVTMKTRLNVLLDLRSKYRAVLDYLFGDGNYGYISDSRKEDENKDIIGICKNGRSPLIAFAEARTGSDGNVTYSCDRERYFLSSSNQFSSGEMYGKDEELLRIVSEYNENYPSHAITADLTWVKKIIAQEKIFNVYLIRPTAQPISEFGSSQAYYLYDAWLYNNASISSTGKVSYEERDNGYSASNVHCLKDIYKDTNNFSRLQTMCELKGTTSESLGFYFLFRLTDNRFLEELNTKIEALQTEITVKESNDKERILNAEMIRQLGFKPTIGNAYRMLFAHMETFLQAFFRCLSKIKNQNESGERSVKMVSGATTDIPDGVDELYPFTLYTKEITNSVTGVRKKEIVLPEEIGLNGLEEMKFINSLISASHEFSLDVGSLVENSSDAEEPVRNTDFTPITLSDVVNFGTAKNPYSYLTRGTVQARKIAEYIMLTFAQRFVDYCSVANEVPIVERAKMFGIIEANNLYKVLKQNQNLLKSVQTYFLNNNKYRSSAFPIVFSSYLRKEDGDCVVNSVNGRSSTFLKNNGGYYWFSKQGSDGKEHQWLPVGIYDVNEIGRSWITDSSEIENSEYWVTENTVEGGINKVKITNNYENIRGIIDNVVPMGCEAEKYRKAILSNNSIEYIAGCIPNCEPEYANGWSCLFLNPSYYAQNAIRDEQLRCLAKAYMTVTSCNAPAHDGRDFNLNIKKDIFKLRNGVYNKGDLLLAGAMFWRYEEMMKHPELPYDESDPIIVSYSLDIPYNNGTVTKSYIGENAKPEESYYIDGYYRRNFLATDGAATITAGFVKKSYERYVQLIDNFDSYDNETKDVLINYFKDWAFNEFEHKIRRPLELLMPDGTLMKAGYLKMLLEGPNGDYNKRKALKALRENTTIKINGINRPFDDAYDIKDVRRGYGFGDIKGDYLVNVAGENIMEDFNQTLCFNDLKGNSNGNAKERNFTIAAAVRDSAASYFRDTLQTLMQNDGTAEREESPVFNDENHERNMKLSVYMTLKGLFDKWLCGENREKWKLSADGSGNSEFDRFRYIDGLSNDIKESLCVNVNKLSSKVLEINNSVWNTRINESTFLQMGGSVYDYLAVICQDNNMILMALPFFPEITKGKDLVDIFTPYAYPYWDTTDTSSYVCLYQGSPSAHLDNNDGYKQDGFNFADMQGQIVKDLPPELLDTVGNDGKIGAFGVTYAKPNQSIFKRITVNTNSPTQTEASIMAEKAIADKASNGPRDTILYGQDIYRLYHGYSYSCEVEMMGDVRVCPMMYFQLNNIPLFRGAYWIINVEHNIEAGNMTTSFKGVRLCANNIPLAKFDPMYINNPSRFSDKGDSMRRAEYLEWLKTHGSITIEGAESIFNMKNLTWTSKNADNTPTDLIIDHLSESARNFWSPVYTAWMTYVVEHGLDAQSLNWVITSGYRSPEVNKLIPGSATNSTHMDGYAIDIKLNDNNKIKTLYTFLQDYLQGAQGRNIRFNQILLEHPQQNSSTASYWIHMSYKTADGRQPRMIKEYTASI